MTIQFEHETRIDADIELVFDLSLDIDVHKASMSASGERAIGGVTSGRIGLGETVTWRATHFRIPFTMTSRVTQLERPRRFVDEQVRGPFHSFRHDHVFDTRDGLTCMIDRVRFNAPGGPVGRVVERALLASYLQRLISTRGEHIKAEAERRSRAVDART